MACSYKWHVLTNKGSEPQLYAVLAQAMPPGILMLALQPPPPRHSPSVSHTAGTSHTLPSSPSGRGSPGKWLRSDPENSPESIETKAPRLGFPKRSILTSETGLIFCPPSRWTDSFISWDQICCVHQSLEIYVICSGLGLPWLEQERSF